MLLIRTNTKHQTEKVLTISKLNYVTFIGTDTLTSHGNLLGKAFL